MNPIMFHYFHGDSGNHKPCQGSMSADHLERVIKHQKIQVLGVDEWVFKLSNGTLQDCETCLTFDDGIREQWDIALPILNAFDIKANFNLCSFQFSKEKDNFEIYRHFRNYYFESLDDYYEQYFSECANYFKKYHIEIPKNLNFSNYLPNSTFYTVQDRKFRYYRDEILKEKHFLILDEMLKKQKVDIGKVEKKLWITKEEVKNLAFQGHEIGLHTHQHPTNLDQWSYARQQESFLKNQAVLESIIEKKITHCAYPCGKKNDHTLRLMKELGIKYAYSAHNYDFDGDLLNIPRIDCTDILNKLNIK
ncbi:polysaccharide deacetylase family protein [Vibrio chagasii]|uniref:polysaccharide deacetylase family protein n=1 Tax=Vibrio chagasii TaxID=170679 RepID=UPI0035A62067